MELNPINQFQNYVNQLIYNDNNTLLEAIRIYLIDNNIPDEHKQMNYILEHVNTIANRYNNELLVYNNHINNMNIPHQLPDNIVRTLLDIQCVQNILNNYRLNLH
jgi:hypothetical protein